MLARLPAEVQQAAREQYRFFKHDQTHPGLKFKRVWHDPPIYSARVGIHYRALARREEDDLIWYWIGSHGEYDNVLKRL